MNEELSPAQVRRTMLLRFDLHVDGRAGHAGLRSAGLRHAS